MPQDSSPATKEDIRLLMEGMGKLYERAAHVEAKDLRHDGNPLTLPSPAGRGCEEYVGLAAA